MADRTDRPTGELPTTVHTLREALTAAEAQAQYWQEQYDQLLNEVVLYVTAYGDMRHARRTLVKRIKERRKGR
jgi:hypothetical protein